ncbi:hypothetical protein AA313_de0206695 [Arthrobotrys entomopaga]|nr:hypothetical protein AA313_de0206695 [Arthrobotrys entomopaga]
MSDELFKKLKEELVKIPATALKTEILAISGKEFDDESERAEALEACLKKYGYESITVDELEGLLNFREDDDPIKPPEPKPPTPKPELKLDVKLYTGTYRVSSADSKIEDFQLTSDGKISTEGPPAPTYSVEEKLDESNQIVASWKIGTDAYEGTFYTRFDKLQKRVICCFKGTWSDGAKSQPFTAEQVILEESNPEGIEYILRKYKTFIAIGTGTVLASLFGLWVYRKVKSSKDKAEQSKWRERMENSMKELRNQVRGNSNIINENAVEQLPLHVDDAVRDHLLDSLRLGTEEAIKDALHKLGEDIPRVETLEKLTENQTVKDTVKEKVDAVLKQWVSATEPALKSQFIDKLVAEGVISGTSVDTMIENIRNKSQEKLAAEFLNSKGKYGSLILSTQQTWAHQKIMEVHAQQVIYHQTLETGLADRKTQTTAELQTNKHALAELMLHPPLAFPGEDLEKYNQDKAELEKKIQDNIDKLKDIEKAHEESKKDRDMLEKKRLKEKTEVDKQEKKLEAEKKKAAEALKHKKL